MTSPEFILAVERLQARWSVVKIGARSGTSAPAADSRTAQVQHSLFKSLLRRLLKWPSRRAQHLDLGRLGEREAKKYLVEVERYRIVATNVEVPLGRGLKGRRLSGEIDIIAYDRETLVFVEVKTRASDRFFTPPRNVDLRKQRRIARAARRYRQIMQVTREPYRYDVVSVVAGEGAVRLELLRGYFDDRVFRALSSEF